MSVSFTAVNDGTAEGSEVGAINIDVTNSGSGYALGSPSAIPVTINDGPSTITLSSAAVIALNEGFGTSLDFTISPPSASALTIDLGISGSLTAADVSGLGTINIQQNLTSHSITITALSDNLDEPFESGTLTISNPSANAVLGGTVNRNLEITDADLTVNFADTTSLVLSEGETTSLTVLLSPVPAGSFTLGLTAGSPLADADITPTSLIIPAGVTATHLPLPRLMTLRLKAMNQVQSPSTPVDQARNCFWHC